MNLAVFEKTKIIDDGNITTVEAAYNKLKDLGAKSLSYEDKSYDDISTCEATFVTPNGSYIKAKGKSVNKDILEAMLGCIEEIERIARGYND